MSKPMNILLLMADQWRYDTLFEPDHPCQTPHLDRMAKRGVVFHNAFTSYPLCSPARGSLFTGLWPHQTGMMDNVDPGSFRPKGKLHPARKTFLERLCDDAGYQVGYCGKWHMGHGTATERGIGHVVASDGGATTDERPPRQIPTLDGETLAPYYGTFSEGKTRDQQAIEAGLEMVSDLAQGDAPFCAVISTWGPHFAHYVDEKQVERYRDIPVDWPPNYSVPFQEENKPMIQGKPYWPCQNTRPLTKEDWTKTCQHYWAYCTHLDEQFGRALALVDALGIADNTVIALCPDHGEMLGAHGMFDKGPYFYEEIMHLPMIVVDPKKRQPAAPESFVGLRDLFPTLLDLAGVEGVLTDAERARSYWVSDHDCAFYCYDAYQGREFKLRGVRTERWKYNWCPNDLCELYDLQNDPGERINLIDYIQYKDIRAELHRRVMDWMASEGDYLQCHEHLLPAGSYIDGRAYEEQNDPGWSEAEVEWMARES